MINNAEKETNITAISEENIKNLFLKYRYSNLGKLVDTKTTLNL